MEEKLLEPQKAFREYYETQFSNNVKAQLDKYIKDSGVNVEENRKTCKEYYSEVETVNSFAQKVKKYKGIKKFFIFLIIAFAITSVVSIYMYTQNTFSEEQSWICILVGVLAAVLSLLFIILTIAKINPTIKNSEAEKTKHQKIADQLKQKAEMQMYPLNMIFDSDITRQLVEKTMPSIKLDKSFNMKRYDYFNGKYGFVECSDRNSSVLELLSGEIAGNPFLAQTDMYEYMGTETYKGSLEISWTEVKTDSDGNVYTVEKSQTLYASITKPRPYYGKKSTLYYGNEAAPNLTFTHDPTYAHRKSEAELKKFIQKGVKDIRKIEKKNAEFTAMENEEFDVLFNAVDRNNENEFRLLFTPLAQKNMVALMKDSYGFGDDFTFKKLKCVNGITADHFAYWNMNTDAVQYCSFDIDVIQREFNSFHKQYFKHLFFGLAPILAIPLYQQHKPKEYIYKDNYNRNFTFTEDEYLVNQIGRAHFAHPNSDLERADVICKTKLLNKMNDCDNVIVTANSYVTYERTEYVSVRGGDDNYHNVPVNWIEYVPIQNVRTLCVKSINMSEKDYYENKATVKNMSPNTFMHGLFGIISDNGNSLSEINSAINALFKNKRR